MLEYLFEVLQKNDGISPFVLIFRQSVLKTLEFAHEDSLFRRALVILIQSSYIILT